MQKPSALEAQPGARTRAGAGGSLGLDVALALLTVYVIWGSTYLAIRFALEGFPPFLMAGGRFLIAGGALYGFQRLRGAPNPPRAQWLGAGAVGALLLLGGNGGVVFAEQSIASGLAALGLATVPVWTAIFAALWGQRPSRGEWLGVGVGFIGVVLLNLEGDMRANPLGAVAIMISAICWALGTVWSRRLALPAGLMASAVEMLVGGALMLGVSAITGERLAAAPDLRPVLALAYLIVFGSLIAFSAYGYLLRRVRSTVAASYAYVNPVVAVGLGAALAGERITLVGLLAMAAILAGVALVTLSRARGGGAPARE
jgi:drug/metabolite transporter (DMT)-like permease